MGRSSGIRPLAYRPLAPPWEAAAPQLANKRLNSAPAEDLVRRWAEQSVLCRLVPTDDPPMDLPDDSLAAPVAPTIAARPTPRPFRLHRVRRR